MLVLFTSRLIMKEMQPRLQARLSNDGITVISQADANRAALVDRLRDAKRKPERIVLLGLRAFWEGVDVPGEALSVLSITRLPFKFHGHPLEMAKKRYYEAGGFDRDYFRDRVVPEVYLHLRQMYGRLIRAENDRGATVITDPRIYVRLYGRNLLQRLPKSTTVVDAGNRVVEAVRCFLAGEEVAAAFHWGELPAVAMDLSPEQRAIVECPSRRILVRAAAGSGKTHVLISRLISLIERKQAKAEEVLALTFTNKAMNVMYERIEAALGGGEAYHMHGNVLTYHKLAMRIIRQDDLEKGMETGFLDENNPQLQEQLFEQAREAAGLTKETLNDEDARTMIAYGQNGLVNEAELEEKIADWSGDRALLAKLGRFFLTYTRLIRDRGLIDYGEAIVKAVQILRENPDQAAKWSNRFKWIFCDEYQDTSPAQATLLQLLGQQANLFVVGDNAQSIYSWQGSDPDNLRRFELDFPNTATFNLSKNYRCFPKLVRMSSRFLEKTGQAYGIRVEFDQKRSTEEQNVFFLHNETDKEEAGAVAGLAKEALELLIPGDPPPLATVGVLARKWDLLEEIEIHLLKQGIPYIFEGETSRGIVANKLVQDLVMRAANIYNLSQSGQELGDTAESRLAMQLREGGIRSAVSLLTATRRAMPGVELEDEAARCFERLCRILGGQDASLIALLFDSLENKPRVVLSTVHSQKGEEFDTVFVIGLEQGNSPHNPPPAHERLLKWRRVVQEMSHATWRVALNPDDLQRLYEEEEKRIFYVAMTRAKYNLVISRAETRYRFGKNRQYERSEFLDLANDSKLVSDVSSSYDVKLTVPISKHADDVYRSDGRVFETNNQVLVRSKSEMLLANEFVTRGMYFEYEEPAAGVLDALPDFSFPDYGDVILEHLGLLHDPIYLERWEAKAKKYEEKGICYFRTGEEEIRYLSSTVDRLQDQFKRWAEQQYGGERLKIIEILEKLRRISQLRLLRPLKSFNQGIFIVEDPEVVAVAICKENLPDGTFATDAATNQHSPEIDKVQGVEVIWGSKSYDGVSVWVGRGR